LDVTAHNQKRQLAAAMMRLPFDSLVRLLVCGGASIVLAAAAAGLVQQQYEIAVNPHVMAQIDRTWIVDRGKNQHHVRVADLTFTMTQAGKPVVCRALEIDIGGQALAVKPGDSIELSPNPDTCKAPYVIDPLQPAWLIWVLIGFIIGASAVLALGAWNTLQRPWG
jgi:hypothetical protein